MLSRYYTKTKNIDKQNLLIKDLTEFYNSKEAEIEVELIESNQREIEIQKEISANEFLQMKNETSKKRFRIIVFASLICILCAVYALVQLKNNRHLNKKISTQNIQLQNQNTELKNFASIASHDLKAPALSISSFASLIERLLPAESDPKIFKYMKYIRKSSSNMSSLVNSLLEFSNLENRSIEITPLNTTQLLNDVINNLYSIIELKSAKISVSENIPKIINGDEMLLKIVFQNLINNALKFVKVDKVPNVCINYKEEDKKHILEIIDNGIGIKKEYLEKIFVMFERLHTSNEYEGSGIGLATCKKIMLLHNGNISIDSYPDKGSTFILTIPKNI